METNIDRLQEQLSVLADVVEFRQSKAWVVVKAYLEQVRGVIVEALLHQTDHSEIVRLQERHRAFSALIGAVEGLAKEAEAVQQELQAEQEHQRDLAEDGLK